MSLIGGIRPPIAALSVLLLVVAGLTAYSLGGFRPATVSEAVLSSQQRFAEDGSVALRAALDEGVTDLDRAAGLLNAGEPVSADEVLDKLGNVYQKWRGTAVVEIESGRLLGARGENLPLTVIDRSKLGGKDGLRPRLVQLENGQTRLLSFALLSWKGKPQQLLIASKTLTVPGVSVGRFRAMAVLDSSGKMLAQDGIPEPGTLGSDGQRVDARNTEKQLKRFAGIVAKKTLGNPLKTKDPGSGGFKGISGSLLGESRKGDRTIAGYASLAAPEPGETTVATGLGLSVVASVVVAETAPGAVDRLVGLLAAGALLVIGGLAVALLLGVVQRPLIRLFLESRRISRGELRRPVTVPRFGETARIGGALERIRRQLQEAEGGPVPLPDRTGSLTGPGGTPPDGIPVLTEPPAAARPADPGPAPTPRRRHRVAGIGAMLLVCAALLLAWAAPLMLFLNRADDTAVIPQQLVNDQRERTDTLSDRVRRALNEGHADLASVASLIGSRATPSHMTEVLEQTMLRHPRYESLYVLDQDGRIIARAGGTPRHPAGQGPKKQQIVMLNHSGKEPVVAGYAGAPGRKGAAVVGEFRMQFLNSLLKRPGLGEIRLVDERRQVIGGNTGYLPFRKLPDERLDSLIRAANVRAGESAQPSGLLYRDGGRVQLAGLAPFSGGGAAKDLGWTVVSRQAAGDLAIPEYTVQNRTVLAGMLGLTAAVACLSWLYIIVARPLRQLAEQAEALADGDRRTVLYPRHHDEVGAVVHSLELLRQRLQANTRAGRN